jgi:hypothetical protein
LPDMSTIGVTYSGDVTGNTQTSGGINYWLPEAPYLSATVENSPSPNRDIITLAAGPTVTNTIRFSAPVLNPVVAIVSLNAANEIYDHSFTVLSFGCGYWGCGTLTSVPGPGPSETTLASTGEGHGVISFPGAITSISFVHTNFENWTGITVGVEGAATSTVPEPATFVQLVGGLLALALGRRAYRRIA